MSLRLTTVRGGRILALAILTSLVTSTRVLAQCRDWAWGFGVPGNGMDNEVRALIVHDDGTGPALYAGGGFTHAGGVAAACIAKWNGGTWTPLGLGTNSGVLALCSFDDGSGPALYAGGYLTSAGGAPASFIAKWDGSS